jgi:hypothetical protein
VVAPIPVEVELLDRVVLLRVGVPQGNEVVRDLARDALCFAA